MEKNDRQNETAEPQKSGSVPATKPVWARRKWSKRPPDAEQHSLWDDQGAPKGTSEDTTAAPLPGRPTGRLGDGEGGASLFQSNGHCCDNGSGEFPEGDDRVYSPEDVGQVVGEAYRVRPCRCRKWYCEGCGPRLGFKLRGRLLDRLQGFSEVYGVTLTVDGSLFENQEAAWQYVMENRLLSRLVRELDRRGHLHSKAYFWVVEFQKRTEQAHWHLLLDASFVPYGELVEIWSRFRPAAAEAIPEKITAENYKGQAPAFGSVRYTRQLNKVSAGFYAAKYLVKYPEGGYPDWVLDRKGRMPRFGHSHRFFPRQSGHDPMCFCEECRGEVEPAPKPCPAKKQGGDATARKRHELKTIRERIEQCEQTCVVLQVQQVELPDGLVIDGRARFKCAIALPFTAVCEFFDVSRSNLWEIQVRGEEVTALEEYEAESGFGRGAA